MAFEVVTDKEASETEALGEVGLWGTEGTFCEATRPIEAKVVLEGDVGGE